MFSFIGELARYSPETIRPIIQNFLPGLIENLCVFPDELDPGQSYLGISINISN